MTAVSVMTRVIQLSAAVFAAALLLSACGNSGDEFQPTQPDRTSAEADGDAKPTQKPASKSDRHESKAKQDEASKAAGRAGSNSKPAATPKQGQGQGQGHEAPSSESVHVDGCPTGITRRQCEAVGQAYEQQQGSTPRVVEDGECPRAMSKSECQAAGEAYEEADEGRVVKPNECPRALTAEQCAEAGRAYEEVTK